uniref:Ig-like domain-containing protein n=1 Tax=Pyxicephalus adspersus TaxID=30357 RepID=A0AAV3ADX7_PYXAD|nr:TPA: hypothetical protein GDO54_013613 [Pyxicephalus adspersus]
MSQTLIQSSSEVKQTGQRVKMSCEGSAIQISNVYIHWYQLTTFGGGLTWIGRIDPDDGYRRYSSSYHERFTMTFDTSINTAYLQIDNVKVEDTATYYCAGDRHSDPRLAPTIQKHPATVLLLL